MRARQVIADGVLHRRVRTCRSRRRPAAPPAGAPGDPPAPSPCPYKGLLRFEPEDASWFFGRERLVVELLGMVATARCTSIVGASGSGKSSLVRGGPPRRCCATTCCPGSASWPLALVVPGTDPMLELARVLALVSHVASPEGVRDRLVEDPAVVLDLHHASARRPELGLAAVLVVDQLEEVFTVCDDEAMRDRFLEVLVHAACDPEARTTAVVAITRGLLRPVRGASRPRRTARRRNVLVGPMRPDELQRATRSRRGAPGSSSKTGWSSRSSTTWVPNQARFLSWRRRCSRRGFVGVGTR